MNVEHNTQVAICELLDYYNITYFKVPNEGKRSVFLGSYFKKEGMKKGVSDLIILLPMGRCIFIEVKSRTGVQTKEQKEFQNTVQKLGFEYKIWRTVDDVVLFLKNK